MSGKTNKAEILMIKSYHDENDINQLFSKSDFRFKYIIFSDWMERKELNIPLGVIKVFNVLRENELGKYKPNLKLPFGTIYEEIINDRVPFLPRVNLIKIIDDFKISRYNVFNVNNEREKLKRYEGQYFLSFE